MKASLTINNVSVDISGHGVLGNIFQEIPDDIRFAPLFRELARHESSAIRAVIAEKDNIDKETALTLLNDDSIEVLYNTLGSYVSDKTVHKVITKEIINRMLSLNIYNLSDRIVTNAEKFNLIESEFIYEKIQNHPDPNFRAILTHTCSVPNNVKRKLEKDSDQSVAMSAKTIESAHSHWGKRNRMPF